MWNTFKTKQNQEINASIIIQYFQLEILEGHEGASENHEFLHSPFSCFSFSETVWYPKWVVLSFEYSESLEVVENDEYNFVDT